MSDTNDMTAYVNKLEREHAELKRANSQLHEVGKEVYQRAENAERELASIRHELSHIHEGMLCVSEYQIVQPGDTLTINYVKELCRAFNSVSANFKQLLTLGGNMIEILKPVRYSVNIHNYKGIILDRRGDTLVHVRAADSGDFEGIIKHICECINSNQNEKVADKNVKHN